MSAATYAEMTERETRLSRIAHATDQALRAAVRLNIQATIRARAAYLNAYRTHNTLMEHAYRDRLANLKTHRQALLDIRRLARESVDG